MGVSSDLAIIGAGPVGLFAVFQAGMLGMRSCVVDALDIIGGQCKVLYPEKPIYDIPGYKMITGSELIDNLVDQAESFNPVYLLGRVVENIEEVEGGFTLTTDKGDKINSKAIMIAAGSGKFGPNRPPINGILEYENKSVFYHVTNKAMFSGKRVAIAGGGDSALDWAIELAKITEKLYLIHRRKTFRCAPNSLKVLEDLINDGSIELMTPYQLASILGKDGMLEEVRICDISSKEEISLKVDFLLPFFGISANLGPILNWGLGVERFHIPVDQATCRTSRDKIYAVGDVAHYQGKLKLILVGFSEVALACHDIYKVLFPDTPLNFTYSTSKGIPGLT